MTDYINIENHMVLGPDPVETPEVEAEVEIPCCNCDKSEEVIFIINEEWSEKELDDNIFYYLTPGKVYCEECFFQVENTLPRQEMLDAHLLWELRDASNNNPIELYNHQEWEDSMREFWEEARYEDD